MISVKYPLLIVAILILLISFIVLAFNQQKNIFDEPNATQLYKINPDLKTHSPYIYFSNNVIYRFQIIPNDTNYTEFQLRINTSYINSTSFDKDIMIINIGSEVKQ